MQDFTPLNMKGNVYRGCINSAIVNKSETWLLKQNYNAILRREMAMVRAMCNQKTKNYSRTGGYAGVKGNCRWGCKSK